MIPLSIVMARSSLAPRQVTKAGESRDVSCSGNSADGIEFLEIELVIKEENELINFIKSNI